MELQAPGNGLVRLAAEAMATRFELVLGGGDPVRVRAAGEEALEEILETDRRLSLFRRDSVLSRINREAVSRPVPVDGDTFELLEDCALLHRATGGAFDPTVAPRMKALGLHGEESSARAGGVEAVGWDGVVLDPAQRTVFFTRTGMALDLGAVGKGHALDRAAEILAEQGVVRALLHGGTSSVMALGTPPGKPGWTVSLTPGTGAPQVTLANRALSLSAGYGREVAGASHVLDPRTGQPAQGLAAAAVVHRSALSADAWSTALLVVGSSLQAMPDTWGATATRTGCGTLCWDPWGAAPPADP